jgi:hypothetical protein
MPTTQPFKQNIACLRYDDKADQKKKKNNFSTSPLTFYRTTG